MNLPDPMREVPRSAVGKMTESLHNRNAPVTLETGTCRYRLTNRQGEGEATLESEPGGTLMRQERPGVGRGWDRNS